MEIVVKINGGLGNQLFQYATGRAIADRTGADLYLDLSFFHLPPGEHTARRFELDRFHTRYGIASAEQLRPYIALRDRVWTRRTARALPFFFQKQRKHERQLFRYEPGLARLEKDTYLDGHWQSERYFADAAATIRTDLRFREDPGALNKAMLASFEGIMPVSLHVRRGDYITNPAANAVHGTCDAAYYERAMRSVLQRSPAAVFHVFSDDVEWAKEHLPRPAPMVFVEHNTGLSDHFDLLLMAACQHHIIANSSFSWWGAWLDPRPDKLVVAPERWFSDPGVDTADLIPSSWVRL